MLQSSDAPAENKNRIFEQQKLSGEQQTYHLPGLGCR